MVIQGHAGKVEHSSLSKPSMRTATGWLLSGLSRLQQPHNRAEVACWKQMLNASSAFFMPAPDESCCPAVFNKQAYLYWDI